MWGGGPRGRHGSPTGATGWRTGARGGASGGAGANPITRADFARRIQSALKALGVAHDFAWDELDNRLTPPDGHSFPLEEHFLEVQTQPVAQLEALVGAYAYMYVLPMERGSQVVHGRYPLAVSRVLLPCIYCGHPAASGEHLIPEALGRFEVSGVERAILCRREGQRRGCNETLGDLVRRLFRAGPYSLHRRSLPRAIGKSARRGNRSGGLAYEPPKPVIPGVGIPGVMHMEQGGTKGGWASQIILRAKDGSLRWFQVPDGIVTGTELRTAVHAAGLGGLEMVHYIGDAAGVLERLLREAWPLAAVTPRQELAAGVVEDIAVKTPVSADDARAIAMLAFHMFLAFATFRGGEAAFTRLRAAITGTLDPFDVVGAQNPDEASKPLHRVLDERPEQQKHLLLAGTTPTRDLVVDLRLFASAKHALWWRVKLASRVPPAAHQLGVAFCYATDEITLPSGRKVDGELVPLSSEDGALVVSRHPETAT